MKRLYAVLMAFCVVSCAAFAQENWVNNVRVEADIAAGILTTRAEYRGAYSFPLAKGFHWDAGLNVSTNSSSLLSAIMDGYGAGVSYKSVCILPFASIWYKDVYLSDGFGLGTTEAGVTFVPVDIRFGWQPHFFEKDKGFCFKIELGLLGAPSVDTYKEYIYEDDGTTKKKDENGEYVTKTTKAVSKRVSIDPSIIIGVTYKF